MGRRPLTRVLDVYLNGRLAGYYSHRAGTGTHFRYDEGWLAWQFRFPISRSLPLSSAVQQGDHVEAVFENLLPDVTQLRQAIAERTAALSDRPHDLLAAIGQDCVGALQFLPHGSPAPQSPFHIEGERQSPAEIARTLRHLSTMPLGIDPDEPFRISLAGAQEKTAYLRHEGHWVRPRGLTPTSHIFKRPMGIIGGGHDLTGSVENEYICLRLAREMGLDVAEAEIQHFEEQVALVVTRFDRRPRAAGGLVRVPQEDFLQAMGRFSGEKYQQHGGPSMTDCLIFLRQSDDPIGDQIRFLKAQLFNWMIAAVDGHAKNYSIFLEGDGFRLAPLYDIISAAPAHIRKAFRHKDLQMAMSVGRRGHYRLDQIAPRHFEETAARAQVPLHVRHRAMTELAEQAPAAFDRVLANLPATCPIALATEILDYARPRLALLQDYVTGLNSRG